MAVTSNSQKWHIQVRGNSPCYTNPLIIMGRIEKLAAEATDCRPTFDEAGQAKQQPGHATISCCNCTSYPPIMNMSSHLLAPIPAIILLIGSIAVAVGQDQSTCNRNGGSSVVWDGRTCDELNYTFTEWCNVVDGANGCQVTAKSCGCKNDVICVKLAFCPVICVKLTFYHSTYCLPAIFQINSSNEVIALAFYSYQNGQCAPK